MYAGKDIFWYTKGKGDGGVSQDELEAVKAREREMMAEVCAYQHFVSAGRLLAEYCSAHLQLWCVGLHYIRVEGQQTGLLDVMYSCMCLIKSRRNPLTAVNVVFCCDYRHWA